MFQKPLDILMKLPLLSSACRAWRTLLRPWGNPGRELLRAGVFGSLLILVVAVVVLGSTSGAALGMNWSRLSWHPQVTPTAMHYPVAERVQAFYQGDPSVGWDSRQQYQTWWPSACSPAALTMDLRAWGVQVGIGPVLDRLIALHAITPAEGLLTPDALALVAREYGYQARAFQQWSVAQVAQVTAQGVPVLLDLRDRSEQTPYPGLVVGHWLVAVGVSSTGVVQVRDSSGYHIQQLSPKLTHILFTGRVVVVWRGSVMVPGA
jgi:hypothetical protein